jgi:hypothetical protein
MAYFSRSISYSLKSPAALAAGSALALLLAAGCNDEDIQGTPGTSAGSGGGGGSAGNGGGGLAGGGGSGAADAGVVSGPSGTIQVLSTSAELRAPTTAAVRGNNLWVVNGQLGTLFTGAAPVLPFNVVSVPLSGGAVASAVIELPGASFYPEGIAAAADGTLFVGSLPQGTVVRVAADSTTATPFVPAGVAQRGVVGLTVDDNRDLLWFCDSNPLAAVPGGAIVGVSLEDGTEVVRHAMPNPGAGAVVDAGVSDAGSAADAGDAGATPAAPVIATFCNDLIVDGTGNLLATDSRGRIFRVPAASVMTANSASVWLSVPEISPPAPTGFGANGLDIVGGTLIVANGGLVAIDPNSANPATTVRQIRLTLDGVPATLCGADGLQTVPGSTTDLVVVENGDCNPPSGDGDRVVRITLDLDD